jgi:hypothetical protein
MMVAIAHAVPQSNICRILPTRYVANVLIA